MNDLEPLPPESWDPPDEPWLAPGPEQAGGAEPALSSGGRRLKTRSKVLLGGAAIMALVAGGFIAGTATGATPSTVRFTDAATSQATSAAGLTACGPVFPGSPGRKAVAGTVASVDTGHSTFAITTGAAPVNVSVSPATRYTKTQAGGTGDLSKGAHVLVRGTRATDGTITAQQIVIVPAAAAAAPGGSGRAGSGTIASANLSNGSGTLTIAVPGGTKTVTVTTATKIYKTASAAFSDVTVGEPVVVAGRTGAAGTVAAALVAIGQPGQSAPLGATGSLGRLGTPGGPNAFKVPGGGCGPAAGAAGRNAAAGTVANLSGGNFTVTSPRGSVNVTTTSATTFTKQIQEPATDVAAGSAVVVVGTLSADGTSIAANQIVVSPVTPGAKPGPRAFGPNGAAGARGVAHGVVVGTVTSNDTSTSTLTVSSADGTKHKVTYGPTTKVTATVPASIHDVKNNGYVVVTGTTGTNGTLSATRVMIGQPGQPGPPGGFGPFGSPGFGRRLAPSAAPSPAVN